jgi:hypothetical protein
MPFKSLAQKKYFFANRKKLESEGVDVMEWAHASKGMKLPEHIKPKKPKYKKRGD